MRTLPHLILAVATATTSPFAAGAQRTQGAAAPADAAGPRMKDLYPVKPLPPGTPRSGELTVGQGRYFSYAMPPGWRVGEDGQFALTLMAPDQAAFTVMVGNAGLPPDYPPARFVHEKLSSLRVSNLRLGPPRPARPVAGFSQAVEFDVTYVSPKGIPCRGIAKCNIQRAYDSAVFAMTGALSQAAKWPGYASWLPAVADQIAAANGAAFGVRGIMAQNLRNSTAFAEAAREYRDWSQKNWQGVVDQRNASQAKINKGVREDALGTAQPYANPFGEARVVELPPTHRYFWMDRQGQVVGTDNPRANPNDGSTGDWRRLERAP